MKSTRLEGSKMRMRIKTNHENKQDGGTAFIHVIAHPTPVIKKVNDTVACDNDTVLMVRATTAV